MVSLEEASITLELHSPHGDQGFPGNAVIRVTYTLDSSGGLHIAYDGLCDRDTVFNMTNHSYFNLAGHARTEAAMEQLLTLPGRFFNPDDAENIPTGEKRSVAGTPMDFRQPKAISRDIGLDYVPLHLQGGYDHNWEVFCNPCAILADPVSGRSMSVSTDCPGIQVYSGNFLDTVGKGGVHYGKRSGIALETQFYPDSIHQVDATANYTFNASIDGTLAVTKRSVTLTSATDEKVYDGEPLTNDEVTYCVGMGERKIKR